MMEITKELRALARFAAGTMPVLSVYLDTQWRDQHQWERVVTFVKCHVRQARALPLDSDAARASLEHDLERLTQWVDERVRGIADVNAPGLACFACQAADLWVEFASPVPFEDEFTIADRPMLRQLARLDEDYTNALLVMVDSRTAHVYEVVLGGLWTEMEFANDVHGRHKQGGWAQARYQRHVQEQIDRHHKDVAAYIATYMEQHPQTQLLVSGQPNIVAQFRGWLPPAVQQQIIDTVSLDMHDDRARILAVAQEAIQRHEREEEQATVQVLLDRAGQGGLAVLGQQDTLAAVNTARVQKLVLHKDFRSDGWCCTHCHSIGEGPTPAQCPVCSGQATATELGEGMVQAVLQADGAVEVIEPDGRLAAYEGVGALLRYKIS
jgi:peptide chain release factor subunit 1